MIEQNPAQNKLSIVFMGTSELSEVILKILLENNYNITGVFTKPDAKIGRKQELSETPVKKMAKKHNMPIFQPAKFDEAAVENLKKINPDLIIVAAYGKIIPQAVLNIPKFGCINVHASLLPKYRGPSPVQNAILDGEKETGITIMLMDKNVDTGDILTQEKVAIDPEDSSATLMEKLSQTGAKMLLETIHLWVQGKIKSQPQDNSLATYCKLIQREDGHINWAEKAEKIYNRYRALNPWPGIFACWENGRDIFRLKLTSIELRKADIQPKYALGQVFESENSIGIQTAEGAIILKEIQKEGKKNAGIKEFINGYPNFIGSVLK
jgi:methionyl-tRNA formyltransferase